MPNIIVDLDEFQAMFPELGEIKQGRLNGAYKRSSSFISHEVGGINLKKDIHETAVYLGTAHCYYLSIHPDKLDSMNVTSAGEGSTSVSIDLPEGSYWKRYLMLSPYGNELLAILDKMPPPLPKINGSPVPYYPVG